ncbi:hypothetical protein GCM10010260_54610 [Streptomyces filipinensis]|uniref:Uncharacterized protein n=1 Tax=Streptomyces filipinensis TaxID=66887 RepID=A0A918IF31_9ACTN|nr:hypothetical protein GCM10010260_54610 [Streptomyces filipinensis]
MVVAHRQRLAGHSRLPQCTIGAPLTSAPPVRRLSGAGSPGCGGCRRPSTHDLPLTFFVYSMYLAAPPVMWISFQPEHPSAAVSTFSADRADRADGVAGAGATAVSGRRNSLTKNCYPGRLQRSPRYRTQSFGLGDGKHLL